MNTKFYRALEDKFRGTRELIKSRLEIYLPFIEPLKEIYPDAPAIDLGCGRGEWLELLSEHGFAVQGIDLDDGMLAACRERDLRVQTGEAVAFLKTLPDESQTIVSGFHLAEHMPFNNLQELIKESLRVLKPAGLLILETPNPENIVVGTSTFYLDPTHQCPIPPELLSFLPEHYGYKKVKIVRLQQDIKSPGSEAPTLSAVLNNVSPDYAVIAQKTAKDELIKLTSKSFELEYGTTLAQLSTAYDLHLQKVAESSKQAMHQAQQTTNMLEAVYNSRSWKITRPLRMLARLFNKK